MAGDLIAREGPEVETRGNAARAENEGEGDPGEVINCFSPTPEKKALNNPKCIKKDMVV